MFLWVFLKNNVLKLFTLFIMLILFGCVSTQPKEPKWTKGRNFPFHYRGMSSLQDDKKKALDEAFYNALIEFYRTELGIILKNKTFLRKREKNDKLTIEYKSSTESKTNAVVVRGIKKIHESVVPEKGKYRAYIEIYIPEEEVIRAKKQAENYKQSLENFVKKEFDEAENLFKKGQYEKAILDYQTIKHLQEEAPGINKDISDIVDARLRAIVESNNPAIRLINLSPNKNYFNKVKLLKSMEKEGIPCSNNTYYVNIGDALRLNIETKAPVYTYILSLWKDTGEVVLLYPNWIEKQAKPIKGKMLFPEESEFVAEPPPGLNYLFVLATSEPLNLNINMDKSEYPILSNEELENFLNALNSVNYDVVKLSVVIKEVPR